MSGKGRINAEVYLHRDGDSMLLESEAEGEALIARLERYVIADDVLIADVTDEFALFHLIGTAEVARPAVAADRFGQPGRDFWIARSERETFAQELGALVPSCDPACAETFRIERGLPRWGHELTDEIIPTEANLESRVIDYGKGCYIGQEVISRIKMSGQTNKRLAGLITNDGRALAAGMRIWTPNEPAKEVGWITSVTWSERIGAQIALGFLKRGHQEVGTLLLARTADTTESVPLQAVALPFI